jgi:hypothetical protein
MTDESSYNNRQQEEQEEELNRSNNNRRGNNNRKSNRRGNNRSWWWTGGRQQQQEEGRTRRKNKDDPKAGTYFERHVSIAACLSTDIAIPSFLALHHLHVANATLSDSDVRQWPWPCRGDSVRHGSG